MMHGCDKARPMLRGFATNKTGGFTAKMPTKTEPVNDGVIDLTDRGIGVLVPGRVLVTGVGVGADNDAFTLRVWGWRRLKVKANNANLVDCWIPELIGALGFVLCAVTGAAGTEFPATERMSDTVTVSTEPVTSAAAETRGKIVVMSPGSDIQGWASVPIWGFEKIEFDTDDTTNTPTMNVLYALI